MIGGPISERFPSRKPSFDSEIRAEIARSRGLSDLAPAASMDVRIRSAVSARGGPAYVPPRDVMHKRRIVAPSYSGVKQTVIDIPRGR